ITLTTYAGLLLWSHKLTDNNLLKQYYSTVDSVNDISSYKVINFAYLESKNILFILFGLETVANDTTTLSNLTVFGLDINSGAIVVPKDAKLNVNQIIAKARDNSEFIFFNSSDQLIVTSGNKLANINSSSKILSFDEKSAGFSNVKGNDDETNDFSFTNTNRVINSGMLIGFLPSKEKGINYAFWLASSPRGIGNVTLAYDTSNSTTSSPQISVSMTSTNSKSFDYVVISVNDNFESIGTDFGTVNKNGNDINANTADRGYINDSTSAPSFQDVYKRFFYTGSTSSNNTLVENFGVLLDSRYSMLLSFASYSVSVDTSTKAVSLKNTLESKVYNINVRDGNNADNTTLKGPTSEDLKNLPNDVSIKEWKFNSVGYDKESDFVYFSLSGQEEEIKESDIVQLDKYYTNTRYINLKDSNTTKSVSVDTYAEESPYTLSDVNFDTYSDNKNLYLTKQVIDGSDGQWLSTTVDDFDDDTKDFKPTEDSKINFSTLQTLAKDLESSNALNNVMPSAMNVNLNTFDSFLSDKGWTNIVSFKSATGNNETGEIRLETEITYANDFGDEVKENGNVSYVSYVQVTGFSMKDFSLTFKQDTDSAIADIKAKYSAEKIVETDSKAFVMNHMFQDLTIMGKNYIPDADTVTLKSGATTDDLIIEIKIPIKTSPTDEKGILPVGFPESDATITVNYNGFTGTETPPMEQYPGASTSNPNSGNDLSAGTIAGIVIGCLALAAIIIATIVLIRIKIKARISV
ncbi:MAG: hypothetical protein K2G48_00410, partial [Malacoplasma sp.]|nr:hypothetical protein [Malacoplasma sp.]